MFNLAEFNRITPKWARLLDHHEELASTNDESIALAIDGAAHGTVVLADHQVSGRGRRGTVWASAPGDGLLFSLILRPDYPRSSWYRLALASGLGIAQALRDEWELPVEIKWPNDLYIDGRKCAGILVESQDGFAVVGVGLNVLSSPDDPSDGAGGAMASISLSEKMEVPPSLEEVLAVVLSGIDREVSQCGDGFGSQVARMRMLCYLTGKRVTFKSHQREMRGTVTGIDDDGSLLVDIDGEVQAFQQAELIRVVEEPQLT